MAAEYNFDEDQLEQLEALLDDENNSLWTAVLYGISTSDDQIVAVALSQIGNVGGEPYWSWYGFGSCVECYPALYRGVPTSVGISKRALFQSLRVV